MPNYQTEQDKAILSQRRGKLAAGIKDPQARKSYIAAQSKVDQNGNDSAQAALAESTNKDEQDRVLGSFKKGGTVSLRPGSTRGMSALRGRVRSGGRLSRPSPGSI